MAIAAAALLKLAALAPEETQRARYQAAAEATVTALVERYLDVREFLSLTAATTSGSISRRSTS